MPVHGIEGFLTANMPSLFALAAPFALLLPMIGQGTPFAPANEQEATMPSVAGECSLNGSSVEDGTTAQTGTLDPLSAFYEDQAVRQVRIERRITIRISPAREGSANPLLSRLPPRALTTRFEERKMADCLAVGRIAGVQTGNGNRLLLFLDDERIISLNLERSCRARDFYSGFYVERSEDGKLCVRRDRLHSRSGAKCEIERMRQLVAVED
ncbi:MAG: hypothetical protein WA985_08940 [Erythrobacter sp.]|uniref:hypothetical protein n=1 Tax=Erythrobacter sp. TaxID=1042 RepID=UPI003C7747D9